MKQLLHTPEGVRDIYHEECARKNELLRRIQEIFARYGYEEIETPTFEFFDIFKKERGSVISREMFKFFDREGNTLVLRPDFTPSIARCAAKYYLEESMPLRFCYKGSAFINHSSLKGHLKEFTQAGVELIGDESAAADAECIAMAVESLLSSGLKEFQLAVSHVGFLEGLIEEAKAEEEELETIRELFLNKNYFAAETLLNNKELKLTELFLSENQLSLAKKLVHNEKSRKAIAYLEALSGMLSLYGVERFVSFDLGMMVKYRYYTGIVIQGYTYGTGEAIVSGGRYDTLMEQFGKKAPAIGFGISVEGLLSALERQKIFLSYEGVSLGILYEESRTKEAICLARKLRSEGKRLLLLRRQKGTSPKDAAAFAKRQKIKELLYLDDTGKEAVIYRQEEA